MSKTKYPIHPDFKKWENTNPLLNKVMLLVMQKLLGHLILRETSSEKLAVSKETIPLGNGGTIQALL